MPGGVVCSVAICKNNSKKARKENEALMFFTFPKDPITRMEWIKKCYREDKWNAEHKRICSKHFKPDDYEDEMRARLLNLRPRKLKKDAVPSLFLLPTEISELEKEKAEEGALNEKMDRVAEKYLELVNIKTEDSVESIDDPLGSPPQLDVMTDQEESDNEIKFSAIEKFNCSSPAAIDQSLSITSVASSLSITPPPSSYLPRILVYSKKSENDSTDYRLAADKIKIEILKLRKKKEEAELKLLQLQLDFKRRKMDLKIK